MTARRIGFVALAGVLLVFAGTLLALRAGWGATDRAVAIAHWAAPPSRFVMVGGVPVHVLEEGPVGAPVVVLVHGSIVNLHEWDHVAALLRDRYRVVRFDWSPFGLTGPDPTGDYTTPRAADLMNGLMQALGHDRFVLVATSNGCNVAMEYNRRFPGHAVAMAFSMLPLDRPSQTRKVDWRLTAMLAVHHAVLPDWRPREFWRLMFKDTTTPAFQPTAEMVDQVYELNNLPGALSRQARYIAATVREFKAGDVSAGALAVRVPVLLQWCDYDKVISQSAAASVKRFANAKVEVIHYPGLGHFPMWENPASFTRDLRAWLGSVSVLPAR